MNKKIKKAKKKLELRSHEQSGAMGMVCVALSDA